VSITRAEVLALRTIYDAFSHAANEIQKREVDLIRKAAGEDLILMTWHAISAADDERIPQEDAWRVVRLGRAVSKDLDSDGPRQIGINFQGTISDGRTINVKVSWDDGYYVATVHTLG
jgi:hypothetical protein